MSINVSLGMRGYFKMVAVNSITGKERLLADWFPNKVLTAGRNEIAQRSQWASDGSFCQIGTGSTPPLTTDTALEGQVSPGGSTTTEQAHTNGAQASEPYYGWDRFTYRFAVFGTEYNVSEVGVGWASTAALFTRSLIVDANGVRVTPTVKDDEFLDVTYELRYYPPLHDVLDTIVLDSITYDVIIRASEVNDPTYWSDSIGEQIDVALGTPSPFDAYDGDIGTIIQSPSGGSDAIDGTPVALAYGNNDLYLDVQASCGINGWLPAGGDIRCVVCSMKGGRYQIQFDSQSVPGSGVPKTVLQTMSLTFRLAWGGVDFNGHWAMEAADNVTTPTSGAWNTNVAQTLLRINWTDSDAIDEMLEIQLENGALVTIVETLDATKWISYRLSSVYTEGTDWTEYTVAQEGIGGGGPTVGQGCTLRGVNI